MPRKDGTGPAGNAGVGGSGRGAGMGQGGNCVCPNCGHRVPHTRGNPCNTLKCAKCGGLMVRE